MTDELKKQFTLRISAANRTELIVILYEMFEAYIAEAVDNSGDTEDFSACICRAKNVIDELLSCLDMKVELSGRLAALYIYINKLLARALRSEKTEYLEEARSISGRLREAFEEISKTDTSDPVMKNAQIVYAGLTYGKDSISESLSTENNRGFLA